MKNWFSESSEFNYTLQNYWFSFARYTWLTYSNGLNLYDVNVHFVWCSNIKPQCPRRQMHSSESLNSWIYSAQFHSFMINVLVLEIKLSHCVRQNPLMSLQKYFVHVLGLNKIFYMFGCDCKLKIVIVITTHWITKT